MRDLRKTVAPVVTTATALAIGATPGAAQQDYRTPPDDVLEILDAPRAPRVAASPDGERLLLAHLRNMPAIRDMAKPMLRLAGRRINPATSARFSPGMVTGFSVLEVADGSERRIELPHRDGWGSPRISPGGDRFFVTREAADRLELWVGRLEAATLERLDVPPLNGAGGAPCTWLGEPDLLLCHFVPADRGDPPAAPEVPTGPVTQEASGRDAPVRTYQDLLENPHDEALYDHYMTSVPALVDPDDGDRTPLGGPAVYADVTPSPDGAYFLVERRTRPYSYLVPDYRFPVAVEVRDRSGESVADLHDLPLREEVPIGGVPTGPRSHRWVPGEPHALLWVEALDEGDPRNEADPRDRVVTLDAPFTGEPREVLRTELRYRGIRGVEGGGTALLSTRHRPSRLTRTWKLDLGDGDWSPELLWERNYEDRYADPGRPVTRRSPSGETVAIRHDDAIYLTGPGASDEGDRPFLDRLDLRTLETERLWRSESGAYEFVAALLADDARRILTRRETSTEPPNYGVRELPSGERRELTDFPDPHPELTSGVERRFVTYERDDGVRLSGEVYLPPDYREGERRPAVVWAYPREYDNPRVASQVRGSPHRFTRIDGSSHLFYLTRGYVIFDGPAMPIVGGDTANDTYVEQLVSSAEAAVGKLDEMGVADPERVGIGGHSYGAFMAANLLAHSDLFRAGIGRSGAYNRSLTPFGFQNEQRTFWEAPEVYFRMSPFMHAHRIDEPLLLIHGMVDNNSGTFPVQSERMYHAVKGLGGTVRLVRLPHESHGYRARESVLHTLAEMIDWFDRWVKGDAPRATRTPGG